MTNRTETMTERTANDRNQPMADDDVESGDEAESPASPNIQRCEHCGRSDLTPRTNVYRCWSPDLEYDWICTMCSLMIAQKKANERINSVAGGMLQEMSQVA